MYVDETQGPRRPASPEFDQHRLRRLLTLNEAADALRKSPAQLRWMINKRTAPPHAKIGGRIMFDADALARWIDAQFAAVSA